MLSTIILAMIFFLIGYLFAFWCFHCWVLQAVDGKKELKVNGRIFYIVDSIITDINDKDQQQKVKENILHNFKRFKDKNDK